MSDADLVKQQGGRNSNIELLRILAMFAIIAHHYVVNSTVWQLFDPIHPTANSIFLHLWGMWGKVAINVFVLITGYFMCQKSLTVKRYLKLLLEIFFWSWVMWVVLSVTGYDTLNWPGVFRRLYTLFTQQNSAFISAFMWMYLLIPALNTYLSGATKRNLYSTLSVLLVMFSFCGTFLNASVFHHMFWYVTLYLIGACIRIHPFDWMKKNKVCVLLFVLSVMAAWCSVIGINVLAWYLKRPTWHPYSFVHDLHKVLAVMVSVSAFLVFRNWRLPQSRFINVVASTTFGVLLIHAASDGMRKWLWQDFVNVPAAYSMSLTMLIVYSVVVMAGVFAVCSALDYLRIRFIERPLFSSLKSKSVESRKRN